MIVLHKDEGGAARGFFAHRRREPAVGVPVHLEVAGPEDGLDVHLMTERPESFIGEAVVVPLMLVLGQPDVAEPIPGRGGGDPEAVSRVNDGCIGAPGAMRHPRSGVPFDEGFESRHESAG
jgi:hypothetical protein